MSGATVWARGFSEYAETWRAVATSSHSAARTPSSCPRQASGAKPTACRAPSTLPQRVDSSAASARWCSGLVTSSSTTSTGVGRERAMRSVSRMPRPKDVSSSSAPCSWAIRATPAAIESLVSTPVMTSFLPSSSMGPSSGSGGGRPAPGRPPGWSERDVLVAPRREALTLGDQGGQRTGHDRAGGRRVDHLIDVTALGGDGRREVDGLVLGLELAAPLGLPLLVVDGGQLAPVQDLDRPLGPHDRDFGGGPGEGAVAAHRLAVHDDVGAGVGERQLGAVADHAPPLLVAAGAEPGRVDEREDRQSEGVAEADEPPALLRPLDVEGAGELIGLVGQH